MIKGIGAGLVFLAAAGFGNDLAVQVRRRLAALYQCKTLVTLLQSQIRYTGADLSELLSDAADRVTGDFQVFCRELAETIRGRNCQDAATAWREAVMSCLARSGMTPADRELFAGLGVAQGYLDGESQCRHLQNYLDRLAPEIVRAEAETGQKSRLYRSLGVFAGLFAAILFI